MKLQLKLNCKVTLYEVTVRKQILTDSYSDLRNTTKNEVYYYEPSSIYFYITYSQILLKVKADIIKGCSGALQNNR